MVIDSALNYRMNRILPKLESINLGAYEKDSLSEKTSSIQNVNDTFSKLEEYSKDEANNYLSTETINATNQIPNEQVFIMIENIKVSLKTILINLVISSFAFAGTLFDFTMWIFNGSYAINPMFDSVVIIASSGIIISTMLGFMNMAKGD